MNHLLTTCYTHDDHLSDIFFFVFFSFLDIIKGKSINFVVSCDENIDGGDQS